MIHDLPEHPDETPEIQEIQPTPLWRITGATIIAILAVVVTFWLVISTEDNTRAARNDQHYMIQILAQIDKYTNPHSPIVKAANARQQLVIDHIILCVENHQDRVTASILHVTAPPVVPGCPEVATKRFSPPPTPKPAPVVTDSLVEASGAIHAQISPTVMPHSHGKRHGHPR